MLLAFHPSQFQVAYVVFGQQICPLYNGESLYFEGHVFGCGEMVFYLSTNDLQVLLHNEEDVSLHFGHLGVNLYFEE